MRVIGIIGGVGSGKSFVADLLEKEFHAYLINMDKIAHKLMQKDEISYRHILSYFGEDILDKDKEIDRVKLGSIVYQDTEKLLKLNSFTHPFVLDYTRKLLEEKNKEKQELICIETALPGEANIRQFCDEIWYVYTPVEIRKDRLRRDRQYDEVKIERIFKNQLSDEEYNKFSTHILNNDGPKDKIIAQIEVLLEK